MFLRARAISACVVLFSVCSALAACSDDDTTPVAATPTSDGGTIPITNPGTDSGSPKDIVDTAVANGSFTLLAAALTKADLIGTLKSAGPFTVLAPNDTAFQKIPAFDSVAKIQALDAATTATLKAVLTYHVIAGKTPSSTVATLTSAKSVATNAQGANLNVRVAASSSEIRIFPTVDLSAGAGADPGSKVILADVEASNGVIHVIDTVLTPPSKDIVGAAQAYGSALSYLVGSVTANGLADALSGAGPLTVFAPANTATAWQGAPLPASAVNANILKSHVASGFFTSGDVVKLTTAATKTIPSLNPATVITIGGTATAPTIAANTGSATSLASAATTDIVTTNGIVHVIQQVLLP